MKNSSLKSLQSFDIFPVMEKASLFGGKITQPTPTMNLSSTIKSIDMNQDGTMLIKFSEKLNFENERPISIKLNYRNISFLIDSKQYSYDGDTLISPIPTEVRAIALRDTARYAFPLNTKLETSIERIEKRGGKLTVDAQMVDVSRNGLAMIISNTELDTIVKNDHIWIKAINHIKLSEPLFGTVIYAQNRRFKDQSMDTKFGVSLSEALPEEIFVEVQKYSKLILTA